MGLGERINEIRKYKRLSVDDLCERSGIPKGTLSKITAGITVSPTLDTVRAIANALECSLDDLDDNVKKRDALSLEEQSHIKKYRSLDQYGQEAVDSVLDVEYRRCEEDRKGREEKAKILHDEKMEMEVSEEIACFILPYYLHPSSAGTGEYSTGDEWEELTMTKRPPRGASYVVRIHGESMEPTFHDGDKVFVRAGAEVMPGQIGIFIMDHEQYIKELGHGELISHNPGYDPKPMTEDARCQGLVLGVCDDSYFE